jgi:hypothetical protein
MSLDKKGFQLFLETDMLDMWDPKQEMFQKHACI